jgi:Tol biopolymer transport system component
MMPMKDDKAGAIKTVVEIVGGQGTINVNSWSPDSKKFAFVSFELE